MAIFAFNISPSTHAYVASNNVLYNDIFVAANGAHVLIKWIKKMWVGLSNNHTSLDLNFLNNVFLAKDLIRWVGSTNYYKLLKVKLIDISPILRINSFRVWVRVFLQLSPNWCFIYIWVTYRFLHVPYCMCPLTNLIFPTRKEMVEDRPKKIRGFH